VSALCGSRETGHPDQALHRRINLLVSRLDEQQRRWYEAQESDRVGPGGEEVLSHITGMDSKTIHRGRQELETGLADRPQERVRLPVGDVLVLKKRPIASKHAGSVGAAGNSRRSLSDQKWVRSSLRHRSRAVGATGPSCESADGGSAVTQLRLFPVSQCEKARSERRPS
jgi:hypothetical protein